MGEYALYDEFKERYSYLNLREQQYLNMFLKIINLPFKHESNDKNFVSELNEKEEKYISSFVSKNINNNNYDAIDNYIEQKILIIDNKVKASIELKKLSNFISSLNINDDIDILSYVVKNNKIITLIKCLIPDTVKSVNVYSLFNDYQDDVLVDIITVYCDINNIHVDYDYNDNSDLYLNNNLKLFLKDIERYSLLSTKEEHDLAVLMSQGDKVARDKFINSNLRLVVSIASRYKDMGIEFLDLISYGCEGLITAADRYDVNRGYKFSTYATHWIKMPIMRAVYAGDYTIKKSIATGFLYSKIKQATSKLSISLGRTPTNEEISEVVNIPVKKVEQVISYYRPLVYIDTYINDEERSVQDILDVTDETFDSSFDSKELIKIIDDALSGSNKKYKISDRDFKIIQLRYGLTGLDPMTLEEIGKMFNLTRQRVNQIVNDSIPKLRKMIDVRLLTKYLDDETIEKYSTKIRKKKKKKKEDNN